MIKKGEQILVINDPAVFPVIFYNRDATGNTEFGSNQEGLKYPSAGAYTVNGSDNAPSSYTLSATQNLERIAIPGYNMNIDALRVVRAIRYNTIPARKSRVAVLFNGTAPAVGTEITVKLTLRAKERTLAEFNTFWSDGEINMYREFTVQTATNAGIAAQFAAVVNNVEMRTNGENALMNILAVAGTANAENVVSLEPYSNDVEVSNVVISYGTFVAANTALTPTLVTVSDNQSGYHGRGIYERMKLDILQTPAKVYPYANESTDGSQLAIKGATYTAFQISIKVVNQTHVPEGTFNTHAIEYFDYWIYVNNSCTDTLTAISGWVNSLNEAATTGRKAVLSASTILDYAAAYAAWSAPQRITFLTSAHNYSTGVDTPNVLAVTAITGFQVTT